MPGSMCLFEKKKKKKRKRGGGFFASLHQIKLNNATQVLEEGRTCVALDIPPQYR